jgi:hypothetical protein
MPQSHNSWPDWWTWDLDCSNPHLAKRMIDRGFNETDLREMLAAAKTFRPDREPGRFVIEMSHGGRSWEVIVEPLTAEQLLLVVTAYVVE